MEGVKADTMMAVHCSQILLGLGDPRMCDMPRLDILRDAPDSKHAQDFQSHWL